MIIVSYRCEDGKLTVRMAGHSGSAPAGEDLVCAACTALAYTLAQAVLDAEAQMEAAPMVDLREGFGKISCQPKKIYLPGMMTIYHAVYRGFELLSTAYPSNIKVYTRGTLREE